MSLASLDGEGGSKSHSPTQEELMMAGREALVLCCGQENLVQTGSVEVLAHRLAEHYRGKNDSVQEVDSGKIRKAKLKALASSAKQGDKVKSRLQSGAAREKPCANKHSPAIQASPTGKEQLGIGKKISRYRRNIIKKRKRVEILGSDTSAHSSGGNRGKGGGGLVGLVTY